MNQATVDELMAQCSRLRDELSAEKRRADVAKSELKRDREERLQEREQWRAQLVEAAKVMRGVEGERDALRKSCDGLLAERIVCLQQNRTLADDKVRLRKQRDDARSLNALAGMAAVGIVGSKLLAGRKL